MGEDAGPFKDFFFLRWKMDVEIHVLKTGKNILKYKLL